MERFHAKISGIEAFLPEYILTNERLSKMVDTSDEWITQRVGIKERRILKGEGLANSDMGAEAVKKLLKKTGNKPEDIELIIVATISPDMMFPSTACLIAEKAGIKNAWGFDLSAACSGFIFSLQTATQFIETGKYKKVVLVAVDKMSSITDYTNRATCVLFGDAAVAMLLEPTTEEVGVIDHHLQIDGSGKDFLYLRAGGSLKPASHATVDAKEHFIYQDGQPVFKTAVSKMADVSVDMMKKHHITNDELAWLVPHQANNRIIEAVGRRINLTPRVAIKKEVKVVLNDTFGFGGHIFVSLFQKYNPE